MGAHMRMEHNASGGQFGRGAGGAPGKLVPNGSFNAIRSWRVGPMHHMQTMYHSQKAHPPHRVSNNRACPHYHTSLMPGQ